MNKYKVLIVLLLTVIFFSCKRNIDSEIEKKIKEFYKTAEAKDYEPLTFSQLDTISSTKTVTVGTVEHLFTARSKNGDILPYTDVFNVYVFEDDVVVMPKGYDQ